MLACRLPINDLANISSKRKLIPFYWSICKLVNSRVDDILIRGVKLAESFLQSWQSIGRDIVSRYAGESKISEQFAFCAIVAHNASMPLSLSLLRARYVPISPSSRGKKNPPPTSGKKPMVVSGIANKVLSVAIRNGAWTDKPTPPPTGGVS